MVLRGLWRRIRLRRVIGTEHDIGTPESAFPCHM